MTAEFLYGLPPDPDSPPAKPSLADLVAYIQSHGTSGFTVDGFTCYTCPEWRDCEFSFDLYNTNGDCLMEK